MKVEFQRVADCGVIDHTRCRHCLLAVERERRQRIGEIGNRVHFEGCGEAHITYVAAIVAQVCNIQCAVAPIIFLVVREVDVGIYIAANIGGKR